MVNRDKCGGPGSKQIFASKNEALMELRMNSTGRKANAGNGKVYRCPWGDHWHITSHKKPGR